MAYGHIFSLLVVLAFLGGVLGGRRVRPAETAEMSIDTTQEHGVAGNLRSLHNRLVNGRKLKGIKVAEVERQMRNYDDLRDALASAQEKERNWLLSNGETFEQPNNAAVDFFDEINKAMKHGQLSDDLAGQLVAETKQKRDDFRKAQDDALQVLADTQAATRNAAAALHAHVEQMEALVEKSKHAEEHEEEREELAEKTNKVEKAEKKEKTTKKKKAEKKVEEKAEEKKAEVAEVADE